MSGWGNRVTPLRTHDGNSVIFCPCSGPGASSLTQFCQATEGRVSQERSTTAGSQHGSPSVITVSNSPIEVPAYPCERPHEFDQPVHQWESYSCVPIGRRPTIRFALAFGWREAKVGFGAPSTYPLCMAPSDYLQPASNANARSDQLSSAFGKTGQESLALLWFSAKKLRL